MDYFWVILIIICLFAAWLFYNKYQTKNSTNIIIVGSDKSNPDAKFNSNNLDIDSDDITSGTVRTTKIQSSTEDEESEPADDLVYMGINVGNKQLGRIVIKLFSDIVPYTAKNFREIAKGSESNKLNYKGAPFHRIIKDFMIQGGDITNGDGTGGLSIYGGKFQDENFEIPHDRPGLLSMANSGPDTNGSQFFITTGPAPHLDGKHVVFGQVVDGLSIIEYLNSVETDSSDKPLVPVIISSSGVVS